MGQFAVEHGLVPLVVHARHIKIFSQKSKMRSRRTVRKRQRTRGRKKSNRRLAVARISKKRGGMPSLEEAGIAHKRDLTRLEKDIKDTKYVIAKFEREMASKPNDDILRAQMDLLRDRLNKLEIDYDDKSSWAIQGWV